MNNKKNILIGIGAVVGLFVILFAVYKLVNTSADYSEVTKVREGDHVAWSPEKKHVLVEYSDLQCPACRIFNELLHSYESSQSAHADIPKKITLVYRHFPLYQIHENAFTLAYAAEASSRQGKFFQMVNAIFDAQPQLENNGDANAVITKKAEELGLDIQKLKTDMNSQSVKDKVSADLTDGEQQGISSTPTFFLDGKKLDYQTVDEFIQILSSVK